LPVEGGEVTNNIKLKVAKRVVQRYLAHLNSDVVAATHYRLPLGTAIRFHEALLKESHTPTVADVAFNLELPVLNGVSPDVLISIRNDEQEAFAVFRNRIREAIKEKLKTSCAQNAKQLAEEIRSDLIDPQLNTIRARLTAAKKLINRKTAVGIALGALATTCGLLCHLPGEASVMAGTSVILTSTGTAAHKYLEELRDIRLSDMYFAWRAAHSHDHS
jgi:hypothetical protein